MKPFKAITASQYETFERHFKLPKLLFESSRYKDMRLDTKVAYSILRDRLDLSFKNNWIDDEGSIYLVYSNANLAEILGCSKSTLLRIKKELAKYGLIKEVQQSNDKNGSLANRIYLANLIVDDELEMSSKTPVSNSNRGGTKKTPPRCQNEAGRVSELRTNETEYSETEYSDYYSSRKSEKISDEISQPAGADSSSEETTKEREQVVTEGQASLDKSTAEVDQLIVQAKKVGLLVTETTTDQTPEYKDVKGLTGDELRTAMAENLELYQTAIKAGIALQDKSVADLKAALALYQANQKAYTQANTALKDAKSSGVAELEGADGRQNQVIDLAKKNNVPIDVKTETVHPKYIDTKGLTGDKLYQAIQNNIAVYQKAVADSVGKQDASTKEAQAKLDAYLKALADYQAGIGKESGIKWAENTTVEAGTAQRMTGDEPAVSWGNLRTAAADAIQSLDRNQNTDAKFDHIFKINGSGTVVIKNTTNGDVTLKISNIQAWTAENTYLAVWGAKDGGIAWGVFATTHGTVNSGAGEGATGGNIGATGAILATVKSYDYEVSTSNAVSTVTFNDIDNNQTVILNGLDGAQLVKGRNVTQSGNSYSAGAGDVSQASGGVIDSNGVQFNLDTAKKVVFSGAHYLPRYINTSIVAGIFGVASEVPKEPKKPELTATKATVDAPAVPEAPKPITVAVQKATVTAPEAPEAPAPIEVEVHYYKMTTTPTPETPTPAKPQAQAPVAKQAALPTTGEAGSDWAVLGGLILSGMGLIGIRKRKED